MPGFKLAGVDSEHKDDVEEDTTGASIGTRVSYGVLGGEWERAKMEVMGTIVGDCKREM